MIAILFLWVLVCHSQSLWRARYSHNGWQWPQGNWRSQLRKRYGWRDQFYQRQCTSTKAYSVIHNCL